MNAELRGILRSEKELYIPHIVTVKNRMMAVYTHCEEYEIYKFICALRRAEYYISKNRVKYVFWLRRCNIRGQKLGYFIPPGVLGRSVILYHQGGVIINSHSTIGSGCRFHGDNCVGNNGQNNDCPTLGSGIELGIGAKVLGNVYLADNIKVGANAVVTKSFYEEGITIAGVPAVKI